MLENATKKNSQEWRLQQGKEQYPTLGQGANLDLFQVYLLPVSLQTLNLPRTQIGQVKKTQDLMAVKR